MSKNKKNTPKVNFSDVSGASTEPDILNEGLITKAEADTSLGHVIQNLTKNNKKRVPRLAFQEDPIKKTDYAGIYKYKRDLLPDSVIKQIRVQNLLVAAILNNRGNAIASFGKKRADRFDMGFKVDIKAELKDHIEPEDMTIIQERIAKFEKLLLNCGKQEGLKKDEKMSLAEFLFIQGKNAVSFGRIATEIVYEDAENTKPAYFRPADVGTIYKAVKSGQAAKGVREQSLKRLEDLTGVKLVPETKDQDEFSWVQVVDETPRQAFTPEEMNVYNFYPSSDIEHGGYPVSPLDTCINSITTYFSIETYNRLYFQNGRAAKGMMVIKSDEIDQNSLEEIKQSYNASINNVQNSFRTPIFGVSKEDEVQWVSTGNDSKGEGEFFYLTDQVSRNILSAFGMAPEEVPGFGHLGRGTSQQALSESSNQYKLEAARDVGLRPLILKFEDFINQVIFNVFDPELAQLCTIKLEGLDAVTREQEAARLSAEMPIHYDYDGVMEAVEKDSVGEHMGGKIPFNEMYRQVTDTYLNQRDVVGHFLNQPTSYLDSSLNYKRDPFFFQHMQILQQANAGAFMAFYATNKMSKELMEMLIQDYLDELEE
jgi:hypothetical protein